MRDTDVNYCPRCGMAVARKFTYGLNRAVCPSCNWIHFEDPKVAAGVLIEQDGKVLLVRRVMEPHRGLWTLPAGFVNANEDPARAAERECEEETGLNVHVTGTLEIRFGREHPSGADFIIFYRGQLSGGSLRAGDDADEVAWFPKSALPPLAFESTKFILKKF
jgi:8-oxo-dGTP diphosphatase